MYCKYCGKKNDNDSVFCCHCGEKVITTSSIHRDERALNKPGRTIKDGIIYEDGYAVGKIPSHCDPDADYLTEW